MIMPMLEEPTGMHRMWMDRYIFINTDETLMTGDIVKVKVTGAYEYDLIGEICQ